MQVMKERDRHIVQVDDYGKRFEDGGLLGRIPEQVDGTYHAWGQKYAPRYLAEFS